MAFESQYVRSLSTAIFNLLILINSPGTFKGVSLRRSFTQGNLEDKLILAISTPGTFKFKNAQALGKSFGFGLDCFNNEGVGFYGDKTLAEGIFGLKHIGILYG